MDASNPSTALNGSEATESQAARGASDNAVAELFTKPLHDDNSLMQLGNYLHKIGRHVYLDLAETKEWVEKKLRGELSDDEDQVSNPDKSAREISSATSKKETAVAPPKRKKILILMSDTGEGPLCSTLYKPARPGASTPLIPSVLNNLCVACQVEGIAPQRMPSKLHSWPWNRSKRLRSRS